MIWNGRSIAYAALSALGLLLPWSFNLQFMRDNGGSMSIVDFVVAGFANAAASSLSVDLLIACTAAVIWMLAEAKRVGIRHAWAFVVLTFGIAFAFAFPLFLFLREQKLAREA